MTGKHKNKMTHGKTYNKSPRRINHKATKSKTNTGTTALERSAEQTTEVKDILNTLKINKATGPGNWMLKHTSKSIAKPLSKLFNLSLEQRIYPNLWKTASVMLLFKKREKSDVSNYRPISLISCVGKSFERNVYKHICNHITVNFSFI